jgi:geranylgeranyl diphosphate synthase type II
MTTVAASVPDTLAAYQAAVFDLISSYLADREPGPPLYDPVREFLARPGKGIRPALCLAACEAFGGSVDDALRSAAAVELLHAAFLIHDDIEDGSVLRRGAPTLHEQLGVPLALNAGDALAVICFRPLLENVDVLGARLARAVLAEFQRTMETTVEGQAIELGWRVDDGSALTPLDYLDVVLRKTCAYTTILPLRVGAMIGSHRLADLDAIAQFGFALGAAFQIRDDVLDLRTDGRDGGDVVGDVREGKRTLMLIHFLRHAGAVDRARIRALFAKPGAGSVDDTATLYEAMIGAGSVTFAEEFAASMVEHAERWFDVAFEGCAPSPALAFLRDVVPYMSVRSR